MSSRLLKRSNSGISLTELMTAMVIAGIIFITIGAYFVNEHTMRTTIIERSDKTQGARTAMRGLNGKLMFAIPATVSFDENENELSAEIRGGHYYHSKHKDEGVDRVVSFRLNDGKFQECYPDDSGDWNTIAENVTHFHAELEGDFLVLEIGVEDGREELQLRTGLTMLGDM